MDFKSMIENESVEDVVLRMALTSSYQGLDRLYVRYKFEVVAEGLLIRTFSKLVAEGKLAENDPASDSLMS